MALSLEKHPVKAKIHICSHTLVIARIRHSAQVYHAKSRRQRVIILDIFACDPFLSPRIVYEVLYRTGTIVISSCMTLGRDNTEIHNLCPIEMSNEAINGLNRIF